MEIIKGSITAPKGFLAAGVHCGIKKKKKDFALIFSKVPAEAAAVFTTNKVKAAPLVLSQAIIGKGRKVQAVIANSGCANACTGRQGMTDALETVMFASKTLGIDHGSIIPASTGKIGMVLPVKSLKHGIKLASLSMDGVSGSKAAEAILTTDLIKKEIAVKLNIGGKTVTIGGIAKGSGMIFPNMATMLCFITTDAAISRKALHAALKGSVSRSFNMITVDGDRSTNDMVLVMANGLAGNKPITEGSAFYKVFLKALEYVCTHLAKLIVVDGEGATKFIEIRISGADSFNSAKTIAFSIANSCLVKTAMFGSDPNWGRIVSAIGNAPVDVDPDDIRVFLNGVEVFRNNAPVPGSREKARKLILGRNILISAVVGRGKSSCAVWTSDLSPGYVKINASYN